MSPVKELRMSAFWGSFQASTDLLEREMLLVFLQILRRHTPQTAMSQTSVGKYPLRSRHVLARPERQVFHQGHVGAAVIEGFRTKTAESLPKDRVIFVPSASTRAGRQP